MITTYIPVDDKDVNIEQGSESSSEEDNVLVAKASRIKIVY